MYTIYTNLYNNNYIKRIIKVRHFIRSCANFQFSVETNEEKSIFPINIYLLFFSPAHIFSIFLPYRSLFSFPPPIIILFHSLSTTFTQHIQPTGRAALNPPPSRITPHRSNIKETIINLF